jgi:hypothetical protein
MSLQIVTANRLRDGLVVFLARDGKWSDTIAEAVVAADDNTAAELLRRAGKSEADNTVVAPYLIDIENTEGHPRPVRYREWLRTQGPTVRTDLGYQAAGAASRPAA